MILIKMMSTREPHIIRGRGASENPKNRFSDEELVLEVDSDWPSDEAANEPERLRTRVFRDASRTILTRNDSPDVGFEISVNPYRGCEHGCIYCYARPTHEYLGFSAGLDFETKLFAKLEAPRLLREAIAKKSYEPEVIAFSGVTDCYQPVERRLELTRGCLEILVEARNPFAIITKSDLVLRDLDLFRQAAQFDAVQVYISVTSLDRDLSGKLEPRASRPERRLAAIRELSQAGIPVGVLMAPVIPGLTDFEMPAIVKSCVEAGAISAAYVPLRLPGAVAPLFEGWLARHFPDRKNKVINRVKDLRGGKMNDPRFHSRMRGEGEMASLISALFHSACKKAGIDGKTRKELSCDHFVRPRIPQHTANQLELF